MMGVEARQFGPLAGVTPEALVPADHFYRHLERTVDLSVVRDLVRPCHATGAALYRPCGLIYADVDRVLRGDPI